MKWVLLTSIIVGLIGWNLWPYAWHGFFYQSNAVHIALKDVVILCLVRPLKNRFFVFLALVNFGIGITDLMDELFFDPKAFAWNDYIFFAINISISYMLCRTIQQRHKVC